MNYFKLILFLIAAVTLVTPATAENVAVPIATEVSMSDSVPEVAPATAEQPTKERIYYGLNVRVDVGNAALQAGISRGEVQQYEALVNVNLQQRFYPTLEAGYMFAKNRETTLHEFYNGQGGFTRIGLDINPLRKNRNSDYFLTVGIRAGMALQDFTQGDYYNKARFDSWGEVVAGVQVKVVSRFTMGWSARIHFLFTEKYGDMLPFYIPGYGKSNGSAFGFNYYLGIRI